MSDKVKIVKAFSRYFDEAPKQFDESYEKLLSKINEKKLGEWGLMDKISVAMIIPKTQWFKDLMIQFFEVNEHIRTPNLDYCINYKKSKEVPLVRVAVPYIRWVYDLRSVYDSVYVTTRNDFPITIETEDFAWIQAPMTMDGEDDE